MTTIERQFLERTLRALIRGMAQATISADALAKSGYDIEMFIEALSAYECLPANQKMFTVSVESGEIRIRRLRTDRAT